jgi:branched-chain amino acid transport system substrate-binding protein
VSGVSDLQAAIWFDFLRPCGKKNGFATPEGFTHHSVNRPRNISLGFRRVLFAALTTTLACASAKGQFLTRDHSVDQNEIRIGMVNAQTGISNHIGLEFKQGYLAYFLRVNREGGIYGRQIRSVDFDDHYEPLETIFYTERLINTNRVFALVGYVGTANSITALSMINEAGLIFLGPMTGAESLRHPVLPLVFNVRASYAEEIESLVAYLVNDLGLKKIAVVRQNDSFGDDGFKGLTLSLQSRHLEPVTDCKFVRNSVDMQPALDQIVSTRPDAVIIMGTLRPIVSLLERAKSTELRHTRFCTLSTVSADTLIKAAGPTSEGMILSQVVPSPEDISIPLVRSFQGDMRASGANNFSHVSLEGYVGAMLLVDGIRRAGPDLTEQRCVDALNHTDLDLKPLRIVWNINEHSGSHAVFLTQIKDGKLESIQERTTDHYQPGR